MELVKAENYLCFFALMETIFIRLKIKDFNQYNMAEFFGVTCPVGYNSPIANTVFSNDDLKLGANVDENNINDYLIQQQLGIRCKYIPINSIFEPMFSNTIENYLEMGNHIIIGLSYGELYDLPQYSEVGHACLVEKVCKDQIYVYDPGPNIAGIKVFNEFKLFDSVRKRDGGLFLLHNYIGG